jgi:hypothetical protein
MPDAAHSGDARKCEPEPVVALLVGRRHPRKLGRRISVHEVYELADVDSPPGVLSEYVHEMDEPMSEAEAAARARRLKDELEEWERLAAGA